jgi:hypothetical protein
VDDAGGLPRRLGAPGALLAPWALQGDERPPLGPLGFVQHANGNSAEDFLAYALERLERCKRWVGSPDFGRHLGVVLMSRGGPRSTGRAHRPARAGSPDPRRCGTSITPHLMQQKQAWPRSPPPDRAATGGWLALRTSLFGPGDGAIRSLHWNGGRRILVSPCRRGGSERSAPCSPASYRPCIASKLSATRKRAVYRGTSLARSVAAKEVLRARPALSEMPTRVTMYPNSPARAGPTR